MVTCNTLYSGVKTFGPIGKYFRNYSSIRKTATPWNYLNLQIIFYLRLKIHLTVVSHLCLILLHTNSILDRRRIFGLWSKDILGNIELNWVCGYPINNTNTCFCHIIAVDRITHINIMQIRNKMITSHR